MHASEGFTRYLDESQHTLDAANLDALFLDVVDRFFGFPLVTYGNALQRGKMDETFISTTVCNGWWSHYVDEDYAQVDPVFSLLPYRSSPFAWMESLETAAERGQQCLRESEEAGLTNGVSLSLRGPGQFYAVSFAGRPDKATKPEMAALNAISNLYHAQRQELSDGEPDGALTPAELRYLGWIAQGKTISETAEICGVADISVSKRLSESYQKLGENGRVRTVLKLVGLGVLAPDWFRPWDQ